MTEVEKDADMDVAIVPGKAIKMPTMGELDSRDPKKRESVILHPRKQKAIVGLLQLGHIGEVAEAVGVTPTTIYRWMKQKDFLDELRRYQNLVCEAAVTSLVSSASEAIQTLKEIHMDKKASKAVRVNAAKAILNELLRVRDQHQLALRLTELEESVGDTVLDQNEDGTWSVL